MFNKMYGSIMKTATYITMKSFITQKEQDQQSAEVARLAIIASFARV